MKLCILESVSGSKKLKHAVVYSCKMCVVGWTDMLLSYVRCVCKSVKWYKKLALHILNSALLSAHALYLMQNEKGMSLTDFQLSSEGFWKNIKKE